MSLGVEELGELDLKKRFPQFNASQAYLDPHGGVLLASKTLSTLSSKARARGVTILENHKAAKLSFNDQVEIETSQGTSAPERS